MSDIRDDLKEAAADLEMATPEEYAEDSASEEPSSEEQIPTEQAEQPDESPTLDEEEDDISQPDAWAAEMRQHWKGLPKDVRKYIAERERQQHAYISRFGSEHGRLKKESSELEAAFKPFEQAIQAANIPRTEVVKQLITERSEMMRDPETFIKRFADHHKLDLVKLAVDTDWKESPEVRKTRWEMQDKQRELEAYRQQVEAQQAQAQTQQVVEYVERWGSRKPHFQTVRQAMGEVLPEIQQSYPYLDFEQQLEATYNAVMRHPNFAKLNRPQGVPASVRSAANGLNGASGVPSRTPEPGSIREALQQAAKETGYF